MSTKTTKPKVSEESRKRIEDYDTTQKLYEEYDDYLRRIKSSGQRAKESLARQIGELGENFVEDLELKQQKEKEQIEKEQKLYEEYAGKVEFIVKNVGDKHGSLKELNSMTYEEIDGIYNKVLIENKKGFWTKLLDFLMGW